MPFILILILSTTLIFGVSQWYVNTAGICPVPISYKLGEIDPRFSVSDEEAKEALLKAEVLWEESFNRDLFTYDESTAFALNLIYDERQQLASTEEEWRVSLDVKEKRGLDKIESVKSLSEAYEADQAVYQSKRTSYEENLEDYNQKVARYNQQGGAPEEEFRQLQREKENLADDLDDLLALEKNLNRQIDNINEVGAEGNRLIELYNQEVVQYNEIYGNREIYTQGDFKKDRINVYKFSDTTELTKVIAHEFGHALGIGHVEGSESIMYYLMAEQPDTLLLSEEDMEAFFTTCGNGTEFSSKVRQIIRNLLQKLSINI